MPKKKLTNLKQKTSKTWDLLLNAEKVVQAVFANVQRPFLIFADIMSQLATCASPHLFYGFVNCSALLTLEYDSEFKLIKSLVGEVG